METITKSVGFAPVIVRLLIARARFPVFDRVEVITADELLTLVFAKGRELGLRLTPAAVPVPLMGTSCGDPGALSATSI